MRVLVLALLILVSSVAHAEDPAPAAEPTTTPAEAARTRCNEMAPLFEITDVHGDVFSLEAHRGKVVLVNFWATWCPPCIEELPHLQKEVFERFAASHPDDFVMIGISREETDEKITEFAEKKGLSLPIAADTDRSVYSLYAEHTIPRNVVVGRDGRILFQAYGFIAEDFAKMIATIERELGKSL